MHLLSSDKTQFNASSGFLLLAVMSILIIRRRHWLACVIIWKNEMFRKLVQIMSFHGEFLIGKVG